MSSSTAFAAQILEASASAFAGSAASLLLERQAEGDGRIEGTTFNDWRSHFQQRIVELAAALGVGEPRLFASRVRWEVKAWSSRGLNAGDLRSAFVCLREVLSGDLPTQAREAALSYLEEAFEVLDEVPLEDAGLDPSKPLERRALRYLEVALEGEGSRAISGIVDAVDGGMSIRQAYEILLAAQREVGRMWHVGELDISEEHLLTTTTERATSVLAQLAPRQPANGKTVVAAAVAENRHGLGPRILADFFEMAGWRAIFLGADIPAAEIVRAVVCFNADLVALSVGLSTQLEAARQTIGAVHALPGREVKILVGGVVFEEAPDVWRVLGGDGSVQEMEGAVSLAQRLVGLAP